jgi:iron(III) transport system permease protein
MRHFGLAALGGGLALVVGWPLLRLLTEVGTDPAVLAVLSQALLLRALGNTLALTSGVLAVALAVGIPLGFILGRTDLPHRPQWRAWCTIPYVVPPYVMAIGWIALLNPTHGVLNRSLAAAGLPTFDIYTLPGMILVMGLESAPFVMLATADALTRMDASLEEQARMCGAPPLRTLLRITLPMLRPALLSSSAFVVASSAAAFGVPYLLASGSHTPDFVLTTRIYQALDLDPAHGLSTAVVMSLALLVIGAGLPALFSLLRGHGRFTTVSGKAARPSPFSLGRGQLLAYGLLAAYTFTAVLLPLGTLLLTSLLRNVGRGLDPANFTFANYVEVLWHRSDTWPSAVRSLWLAAVAASVAVAVAGMVAWFRARRPNLVTRGLAAAARIPYAIPGTVLGLGMVLAWSTEVRLIVADRITFALALADTLWLLGLAYTVKFLALPLGQVGAALESMDPGLEEAGRLHGATPARVLRSITAPILKGDLLSSWFLVFFAAFTEVTLSVLLAGPRTRVLGTLLFDLQTYGDPPAAAVLAVCVAAFVLVGQWGIRILASGRADRG